MSSEKEKMNPNMEKIFFRYILDHAEEFNRVENYFFRVDDIQYVYTIIRDEFLQSKNKQVPSNQQIIAMLKLREDERIIDKGFLKILLQSDNSNYEKEWLEPRYKAWKKSILLRNNMNQSITYLRGLDEIDFDQVTEISNKIRNLYGEMDMLDDVEEDMGLDFDEPEDHIQEVSVNKLSSGWGCMDSLLKGGWGRSTLNIVVGSTNSGKSLWLQNISVKLADAGKTVLYVTLEMADYSCIKRIGSMGLKIDINEYDEKSKDSIYMKNKINELKSSNGGMFENNVGKIIIKKFPTGSCTVTDIDLYITKIQQKKKIKFDAIIVDYIGIMGIERGLEFSSSMLFLKGKHLAENLRYLADKHEVAMFTATQTDKDVWGANDLELKNIPESKAIAETADIVFGIIRNPEMRKNNKYRLKIMKMRDGDFKDEVIRFDLNPKFLTMENDEFVS